MDNLNYPYVYNVIGKVNWKNACGFSAVVILLGELFVAFWSLL